MAPAAAIAVQTTASWTDGGVNSADSQQVVISKPSGASEWKVNATSGTGTNTTGWRTSASWTDTGVYDNQQVGYQADYKQLTVDDDFNDGNYNGWSTTDRDGDGGTSFTINSNRMQINAGGADTWTGDDEYGSVYRSITGDFVAIVKVNSQENTNSWAKAGIMVRNNMPGSGSSTGYVFMVVTPGNGYSFQWDSDANGYLDQNSKSGSSSYPCYLKLVKSGTTFTGYYSTNGTNWTQRGSATVASANSTQHVGMSATSHDSGNICTVQFDDFEVEQEYSCTWKYIDIADRTAPSNAALPTTSWQDQGVNTADGQKVTVTGAYPAGATQLKFRISTSGGTTIQTWGQSATTSHQFTGVADSQTVKGRIRAYDDEGNYSSWSAYSTDVAIGDRTAPSTAALPTTSWQDDQGVNSADTQKITVTGAYPTGATQLEFQINTTGGTPIQTWGQSDTTSHQFTGVADSQTVKGRIRAYDDENNYSSWSAYSTDVTIGDRTAPTVPDSPTVTWIDQGVNSDNTQQVTVSIPALPTGATKIRAKAASGTGCGDSIWYTAANTYTDTDVYDNQPATYYLRAQDDDGNYADSGQASDTLGDRTRPGQPGTGTTTVTGGAANSEQNTIGFTGLSVGYGGTYNEYRFRYNNSDWSVWDTATTYTGTNADGSTQYKVRARTYDAAGNYSASTRDSSLVTSLDRTAPADAAAPSISWQDDQGANSDNTQKVTVTGVFPDGATQLKFQLRTSGGTLIETWGQSATTSYQFSGVADNQTVKARVLAYDDAGNYSTWSPYSGDQVIADRTAPTIPSAPTGTTTGNALNSSTGYVSLNWSDPGDEGGGITGYTLWIFNGYQYESFDVGNVTTFSTSGQYIWPTPSKISGWGDDSQSGEILNHSLGSNPGGNYGELADIAYWLYRKTTDETNDNDAFYLFRVSAYDGQGNESTFSNEYTVTLPDRTSPSATTAFNAEAITATGRVPFNSGDSGEIDLSWINPGSDFNTVDVRRATGGYPGRTTGTSVYSGSGTSDTDDNSGSGLNDQTTYYYKIWTYDAAGNWCQSEQFDFDTTPDRTRPSTTTGFSVTAVGDALNSDSGHIDLSWTNPASDFGFVVIRRKTGGYPISSTDGDGIYTGAGTGAGGVNTLTDSGLDDNVRYYYRIWVFDGVQGTGNQCATPQEGNDIPPDRTAPQITGLNSGTHGNSSLWYKDNTPEFDWTITDAGGSSLSQAKYLLNTSSSTVAATVISSGTAAPSYNETNWTYPSSIPDGDSNWFHLAATDGQGNNVVAHYHLQIDATAPTFGTLISSSSHGNESTWYQDVTSELTWAVSDTGGSTILQIKYLLSTNGSLTAEDVLSGTGTTSSETDWTYPANIANGTNYFYVAVEDKANGAGGYGNYAVDKYTLLIDNEPPTFTTAIDSSSHSEGVWKDNDSPLFSWTMTDGSDCSGVAEIRYYFDTNSTRNAAYVLTNGTSITVGSSQSVTDWSGYSPTDLDDGERYLYVAMKDNASPANTNVDKYLVRTDITAPVLTALDNDQDDLANIWHRNPDDSNWTNADSQNVDIDFAEPGAGDSPATAAGLTALQYQVDSDGWQAITTLSGAETYGTLANNFSISLSEKTQGEHTIYFKATDQAGNESSTTANKIVLYRDTEVVGGLPVHIQDNGLTSITGDKDSDNDDVAPETGYDDDDKVRIRFDDTTETYSAAAGRSGIKYYLVDVDNPAPATDDTGPTHTWTSQSDGTHTYYVRIEDMVGNQGDVGEVTIVVDTTLPTIGGVTITGEDGIDNDWDKDGDGIKLTANGFADSAGSGFKRHLFEVGSAPDWNTDDYVTVVDDTYSWPSDVGTTGDYTFHARTVDRAGNISSGSVTAVLYVDEVNPDITGITFPDQDDVEGNTRSGNNDTFADRAYHGENSGETVRFTFAASDNRAMRRAAGSTGGSPPVASLPNDENPVTGEWLVATLNNTSTGNYSVTITIYDRAGNSDSHTEYWALDNTAPAAVTVIIDDDTDSSGDGVAPISGWYDDNGVDFQWTASSDSGSGLPGDLYQVKNDTGSTSWSSWQAAASYSNLTTTPGNATARTISVRIQDRVGNTTTSTANVYVDISVPAVPTVTITADTDSGPGIDDIAPINDPGGDGVFYDDTGVDFSWTVPTDAGGLRTSPYTVRNSAGNTSWTSFQSGTGYSNLTTSEGNGQTVYVRAADKAGNVRIGNTTLTVDLTVPTLSSVAVSGDGADQSCDSTYDKDGVGIDVNISGYDDSSGSGARSASRTYKTYYVATGDGGALSTRETFSSTTYTWPDDIGSDGAYTIYVRAVDQAGNVSAEGHDTITVDEGDPVITDISFPRAEYGDGWDEIAQHSEGSGEAVQFKYTFTESNPYRAECHLVDPSETNPADDGDPVSGDTFSITLNDTRNGVYEVTITLYDRAGNSAARTEYWNLNTQTLAPYPPLDPAEIIYPADQHEVKNGDKINIYSEILGDHRLMESFSVDISNIKVGTGITVELIQAFEEAELSDFNGGDPDGWSSGGGISSSSTASGDHLWLRLGATSGYIQKALLSIDADEHKLVELTMGAYTTDPGDGIATGKISFTKNGTNWYEVAFDVPMENRQNPPEKFVYVIDMSVNANWSGAVTGLRLYPFDAGSGREAYVDNFQVRNARYKVENVEVAGTTGHADQTITFKVGAK